MKKSLDWYSIRLIGKSKLSNSMYYWLFIVPIAAKVLSEINEDIRMKIFGQDFNFIFSLPFNWKMFFFSALFFSIGNVIFNLFCPKIIKDHLTLSGFTGDGKFEDHLHDYAKDINSKFENFSGWGDSHTNDERALNEHIRNSFWRIYNEGKLSRSAPRIISGFSYMIGFILLAIVILRGAFWVIKSMI